MTDKLYFCLIHLIKNRKIVDRAEIRRNTIDEAILRN
jgi:hypothetical protein